MTDEHYNAHGLQELIAAHGPGYDINVTVFRAMERSADQAWHKDCVLWLYRGAWQEWEPEKVEMAVPLSPGELKRKWVAIFKHESQKDRALFPGVDEREFWQRAEDRNRGTANVYDQLGLAEYEAMEGFVRWTGGDV